MLLLLLPILFASLKDVKILVSLINIPVFIKLSRIMRCSPKSVKLQISMVVADLRLVRKHLGLQNFQAHRCFLALTSEMRS